MGWTVLAPQSSLCRGGGPVTIDTRTETEAPNPNPSDAKESSGGGASAAEAVRRGTGWPEAGWRRSWPAEEAGEDQGGWERREGGEEPGRVGLLGAWIYSKRMDGQAGRLAAGPESLIHRVAAVGRD